MDNHDAVRALFRTVGPNPGGVTPEDGIMVSNKRKKFYTCPLCDWSTTQKWQMTMHNKFPTAECQRIAFKKARKSSQL